MLEPELFEAMQGILLDQDVEDDPHFVDKWDLLRVIVQMHMQRLSPDFPPEVMKTLMLFSKDQGNYMFRKKLFPFAHELYYLGTIIAYDLRNKSVNDVDLEFVSVLFANLAFSKIKLDRFTEAVEVAKTAISLNSTNIKAYYRLVVALKALHRYDKALDAARTGERKAREKGLMSDVRSFSELTRELEVHISASVSMASQASRPIPSEPAQATVSVSTSVSKNAPEIDNSWLQGTNIHANNKQQQLRAQLATKAKSKKKKGKHKVVQQQQPKQNQPQVNKVPRQPVYDYTSSSEGQGSETEDESEEEESEEETPYHLPAHDNRFATLGKMQAVGMNSDFGMGLDDFDVGLQKSKAQAPKPQIKVPPLPPSLEAKYEPRLACSSCFVKDAEGMVGTRFREKGQHQCARDILLVRSKQDVSALWLKVRARPQKMSTQTTFGGKFKLCQQYQAGLPCKIGETNCTFAHSETEIDFWNLDRSGHFNVGEYMTLLKKVPQVSEPKKPVIPPAPAPAPRHQPPPPNPQQPVNNYRPAPSQPAPVQPAQPRPPLLPTPDLPHHMRQQMQLPVHSQPHVNSYNMPPRLQPYQHPLSLQGGVSYIDVGTSSQPYQFKMQQQQQQNQQQQQQQQSQQPYQQQYQPPSYNNQPQNYGSKNQNGHPKSQASSSYQPEQDLEFPLRDSHDYGLVCQACIFQAYEVGEFMINLQLDHKCDENILVLKKKGFKTWFKIRERLNHRTFPGRYILCRYFTSNPPMQCARSIDECSYAHSLEEQYLWGLEKDEQFSIRAFILSHSKKVKTDSGRVEEHFRKYGGQFRFLCGFCFYGRPCRIVFNKPNQDLCASNIHMWSKAKLLVHVNLQGQITPIAPRPFVHKTAFFRMCSAMQYCNRRVESRCHFAHSNVERDIWYIEKDAQISRDEIVQMSQQFHAKLAQEKLGASGPQVNGQQSGGGATPSIGPAVVHCPYNVIHVCGVCWKKGDKRTQKGERCNGPGTGHMWKINKICMLVPQNKVIRPIPNKIPNNCNYIICKHIREKRTCDYSAGNCQFAHSQQEVQVWTWMVKNNVRTLDGLIQASSRSHGAPAAEPTKKIGQGQSVVSAAKAVVPAPLPTSMDLQSNAQYCRYCSVICESRRVWEEHCASEQHMFNVNSDKEHQWNFRQPPWGIMGTQYQICFSHQQKACRYSNQPDMYNLCQFAHSQEELDEWRERWRWREMKRQLAKQEGVYSYMQDLLEDYEAEDSGVNMISEKVVGVDVSCDEQLSVYHQQKSADITWTFLVRTAKGVILERVALLYDQDRLHFSVVGPDLHPHTQIAQGGAFQSPDRNIYTVKVKFAGGMFGSFMQWIVFDFGKRPVLVRKLNVELGTQKNQEQIKRLRKELNFDRWTGDNRHVVRFDARQTMRSTNEFSQQLVRHYKAPSSADTVINQQSLVVELNQHNYLHKMHKLLYMEELAQQNIIASYNLKTEVDLQDIIKEDSMIFAQSGELFARVPLHGQLSEDTNAGKLILTSVCSVLVAPQGRSDRVVYEAVIVDKEHFDYDGRGRDYIYMCLSPSCCRELGLRKGMNIPLEIQFQMSRLPFCEMHKAVDLLKDTKIVFPDLSLLKPGSRQTLNLSSHVLNEDQMTIIRHIVAESDGYTPPLIIYGSFGTGKSETLAQATMLLLKQRPNARILLCTHSNSAADLYIVKHLDAFATSNPDLKMLRIYQERRRLNTVPPVIKKYCLISEDMSQFVLPTARDIQNHHVVITTLSMSLYLAASEQLTGHFQHIFIDEAAQALECQAIMPLSLATETTCVVLAGDHMQMNPKVYSSGARQQRLHQSLLERIFRHYSKYHIQCGLPSFNVLLRKNYRTRMEILRFISATFYGGPERLECKSNQTETNVRALRFYAAHGCEVQDYDSTSYYNMAEIEETVDRINDLYNNWPAEWEWVDGRPDASTIGVVTPYYDHVQRLRASLRKKRRELREVNVDRVMNVQGKEFRALFISTVRTRHLLENPPNLQADGGEYDGEMGDLGFLSDEKLLNTAMTRAKSMVAVVGDPVALCVIGKSMSIWRTFLKHCQKMKTIYPTSITLETVQSQVRSLMNSHLGANLQKMANLSKHEYKGKPAGQRAAVNHTNQPAPPPVTTPAPAPVTTAVVTNSIVRKTENTWAGQAAGGSQPIEDNDIDNPFDVGSHVGFFEDWSMEYRIEPDEILKQLAKESMSPNQKSAWASPPQQQGSDKPHSPIDLSTPLKIEDIQVKRQEGHAVVHYKPNWEQEARKRKLLSANDYERHFNSDSDYSDDEEEDSGGDRTVYPDYTQQQLKSFLLAEPDKYKKCILKVESSMNMHALDQDPKSLHKRLRISSRLRCGRGFDQDEVVVEVLETEDDDLRAQAERDQEEMHGRVVGILQRAINPKYRMFVCTVEEGNTGLMVPMNRGIPKLFNLETPHCHNKAKKGHVCVYTFSKNKEITFHHWEPVDQSDPGNKLFIVRYLKWDAQFYSPLGIVVGVLPAGTTVEDGMNIINLEHYIPKNFKEDTISECERIYHPNYQIPSQALHNRLDLRNKLTFTIDPPESLDLDDALSIEPLPADCYNVGVHISDVSYFVKAGSYVDNEAHARGVTYYPVGQEPIPMIPDHLSTDLCSLLPEKDRLTLSLFLTVNHEGEVLKAVPKRAVIRSKHRLTYNEVESVLTEGNEEYGEDLQESLMMLQRISQIWRRKRLGNSALYQQLELEDAQSPNAHMLVEELMVMANHQIATLLMDTFPTATPLRQQLQPNELELALWRSLHQKEALQSVALTRGFLPKGQVCTCDEECQCVEPVVFEPGKDFVNVSTAVWDKIKQAVDDGDLDLVQNLVVNPQLHPQLAMATLQLQRLMERGVYVGSGDVSPDDRWHYSLNLPVYTHFTSPIRRFVDLLVHRLVTAYIDSQPAPYTQHDLKELMAHCTDVTVKAKRYERATHALQVNVVMKAKPLVLYPVVEAVEQDSIKLNFPTMRHITPAQGSVSLSKLNLSAAPRAQEDQVVLSWQQRIYDLKKQHLNPKSRLQKPMLDTNRFIVRVPAHLWHQLITAILQEDQDRMLDIYDDTVQAVDRLSADPRCIADLSSEVGQGDFLDHFVNFEAVVGACSVLRVQMASGRLRGLVSPKIQLLSLTPTLDLCLEHRSDPIRTFAEVSTIQAAKQNYGSAEAYRDSWLSALRMEAAVKALSSDESAVVHNAPVVWKQKGNGAPYAVLTLPLSFCTERQIKLCTNVEPDADTDDGDDTTKPFERPDSYKELVKTIKSELAYDARYYDYVCVRYSGVAVDSPPDVANNILADELLNQEQVTWVGHCLVTMVTRETKADRLVVHMDLHQSAVGLPDELLQQPQNTPRRATVEWIAKTLPDRRMEKALCDLPLSRTTDLARDIALGRNPADLDSGLMTQLSELTSAQVPKLAPPNIGQEQAIRYSLTHPFSLIQGPPGTGKTVTGVRLAYLFAEINRRLPTQRTKNGARAQVLYCGPSNKSVDVVATYLKKLGPSCPRLLRVYSERIEQRDYPLPMVPMPPRARRGADNGPSLMEQELRDITLHHVIRQDDAARSGQLLRWDKYFKEQAEQVGLAEVQEYQNLVAGAQIEALKAAEIILCTCTASSSPKLLLGTNIRQLIIDECGMCTEPESLVPIVALRPQQVVLIGDHKQLRPIVTNASARNVGLERSLFERYSDKAQMLTTQYRMHESIAEFPSGQFYHSRLECGREEQKKASILKFWPGSRLKPITFVHMLGREESLAVSTADGSEQSKSNSLEVAQAVKTATMLNRRFHVKARDMVILSQYRAQCAEITKQLHLKGQDETDVSTVIASQGSEWDYVILSTVRTMPKACIEKNPTRGWILRNLGFITDQNQINVALTRARKGLIIIGNKHLLKVDPMWRKLLIHYERHQKVVDANEFMR